MHTSHANSDSEKSASNPYLEFQPESLMRTMKRFLRRAIDRFTECKLYLPLIGAMLVLLGFSLGNSDVEAFPNASAVLQNNTYKATHDLRRRLTGKIAAAAAAGSIFTCTGTGIAGIFVEKFVDNGSIAGILMMGIGFTLAAMIIILAFTANGECRNFSYSGGITCGIIGIPLFGGCLIAQSITWQKNGEFVSGEWTGMWEWADFMAVATSIGASLIIFMLFFVAWNGQPEKSCSGRTAAVCFVISGTAAIWFNAMTPNINKSLLEGAEEVKTEFMDHVIVGLVVVTFICIWITLGAMTFKSRFLEWGRGLFIFGSGVAMVGIATLKESTYLDIGDEDIAYDVGEIILYVGIGLMSVGVLVAVSLLAYKACK